jgi:hypothetical protein
MTGTSVDRRAKIAYLGLLAFHAAHVAEEVLGRFFIRQRLGLVLFLVVNGILFGLALTLYYFWRRGRRWAALLSALYAGFMVLNGVGHNIMTLATGRYFEGYAGGFSGIGLAVSGSVLLSRLRRGDQRRSAPA